MSRSREHILAYLNSGRRDEAVIITWYCLDNDKDPSLTERFIRILQMEAIYNGIKDSLLNYCYEYALTYYLMKYNIILVHDKNNNFINAF